MAGNVRIFANSAECVYYLTPVHYRDLNDTTLADHSCRTFGKDLPGWSCDDYTEGPAAGQQSNGCNANGFIPISVQDLDDTRTCVGFSEEARGGIQLARDQYGCIGNTPFDLAPNTGVKSTGQLIKSFKCTCGVVTKLGDEGREGDGISGEVEHVRVHCRS